MTVVAVIIARAGSQRLKNKNRLRIGNKSLVDRSIEFAKKLKFIDDIILSTDDKKIAKKYIYNSHVKVFDRPKVLSKNKTKVISVILNIIKIYEKKIKKLETIVLLQPTSPFRSKDKLLFAFRKYKFFKKKKSIVSISESKNLNKRKFKISNKFLMIIKKDKSKKNFELNGNFYIASKKFLIKRKSFLGNNKTFPIILKSKRLSIDIDTKKDYILAKTYYNERKI